MGLFEAYPWLLIPLVILIVEVWGAVKGSLREPLPLAAALAVIRRTLRAKR